MSNKHGDFIWYELLTPDANSAQTFYSQVLGWQVYDSGSTGMDYRIMAAPEKEAGEAIGVAGLMQITDEMAAKGARPVWLGYIAVDDVDASLAQAIAAGGKELIPATDIPNVGRFAFITDPQGVPIYIMRGFSDEASLAFAFDKPRVGHCAWNELATTDPLAAMQFYSNQFGWIKDGEMDMGEMGAYEFLRHGGVFGALMPKPAEMPVPLWTYYFRVANIHQAIDRVVAAGGQIVFGPQEVPGGEFIVNGIDPTGAMFALVGVGSQDKSISSADKITTCLWYDGAAEEAAKLYTSLIPNSCITNVFKPHPDRPALMVEFTLAGVHYQALNGGSQFQLSEAVSIVVKTESQQETDSLWQALIVDGGSPSQCGWLKDRFGLSWQIVPRRFIEMMQSSDGAALNRVTQAMLQMTKLDIVVLEAAFKGRAENA